MIKSRIALAAAVAPALALYYGEFCSLIEFNVMNLCQHCFDILLFIFIFSFLGLLGKSYY